MSSSHPTPTNSGGVGGTSTRAEGLQSTSPAGRNESAAGAKGERSSSRADDICPTCKSGGKRNLVICIDGTSNQFGIKNTNVVELYSRLVKDDKQLTFYNSGIGTYAKPSWRSWGYFKQVVDNKLDLAFAFRFENIMLSAYAWLVDNYEEGDRIFMFGFSRGAYQVRALSAMLDTVGLLHKGNDGQIPFAYELYAASDPAPQERPSPVQQQTPADDSTPSDATAGSPPAPSSAEDPSSPESPHDSPQETRTPLCTEGQSSPKIAHSTPQETPMPPGVEDQSLPEIAHVSLPATTPWASRIGRALSRLRNGVNRLASRVSGMYARSAAPTALRRSWTAFSTRDSVAAVLGRLRKPLSDVSKRRAAKFAKLVSLAAFRIRAMCLHWTRTALHLSPRDNTRPFPRPEQADHVDQIQAADPNAMQKRFKKTFSRDVMPHFIGAWDTVSSVGFIRDKTLPGTTDGMNHVCFFRHALAMHEHRVKFLPEYVNGGAGPSNESTKNQKGHTQPHTKEVWFTGSHSDIGGGNAANASLDKFGPALRWMSFEAVLAGLRIGEGPREWDETPRIAESMTGIWKLVECLPVKRLSYGDKDSVVSWPPHLSSQRRILPNQLVHESVFTGMKCTKGDFDLEQVEQEDDAFTAARVLLALPTNSSEKSAWMSRLKILMQSQSGIQSLIDLQREMKKLIGRMVTQSLKDGDFGDIKGDLCLLQGVVLRRSLEAAQDWKSELEKHSKSFPLGLHGHTDTVFSVAFIDTRLVVSGSWDGTLRLWNIETGETLGDPASGHSGSVYCVAVSSDGSIIASGSYDGTIRTWRLDEGRLVSTDLIMSMDEDSVLSLAFSPDGSRIVSGHYDGALYSWDAATGQPMGNAAQGHGVMMWSVAFSPDGARIASGSYDRTVRLWDARTLEQLGHHEHTARVTSVAFSPDGTSIACGTIENGICICSADTLEPMSTFGERCTVLSVPFSPTGRHIAAGFYGRTVRIWDVTTGEEVGVLKGHTDEVSAVEFSPDGTRIVSGSKDCSIRVWDCLPISDYEA